MYSGIIDDPRSEKEKAKDWDSKELALGFGSGSKITEIPIKVYNQQQTSSCVAHAILSMFEYNSVLKKDVSRFPLYRKRFNYPAEGSNSTDLIKKSHSEHNKDGGLVDYSLVNHPKNLTEKWANSLPYEIGKDITVPFDYFTITDWNELEKIVNSGLAVTLAFYSTVDEWSKEYVDLVKTVKEKDGTVRHQITLIPKGAFVEYGKLWFSIHDSSPFDGRHLRYATLDFLKARVIVQPQFAIPKQVAFVEPTKIGTTLTSCKLGDTSTAVRNLQGFLADNKFLDRKFITGFYGQITAKAVLWFQLYYHLEFKENIPGLIEMKGEFFGPQSVKLANKIKLN